MSRHRPTWAEGYVTAAVPVATLLAAPALIAAFVLVMAVIYMTTTWGS